MTSCFRTTGPVMRRDAFPSGESVTAKTTAPIPTKFCLTMKIRGYASWVAHQGGA